MRTSLGTWPIFMFSVLYSAVAIGDYPAHSTPRLESSSVKLIINKAACELNSPHSSFITYIKVKQMIWPIVPIKEHQLGYFSLPKRGFLENITLY